MPAIEVRHLDIVAVLPVENEHLADADGEIIEVEAEVVEENINDHVIGTLEENLNVEIDAEADHDRPMPVDAIEDVTDAVEENVIEHAIGLLAENANVDADHEVSAPVVEQEQSVQPNGQIVKTERQIYGAALHELEHFLEGQAGSYECEKTASEHDLSDTNLNSASTSLAHEQNASSGIGTPNVLVQSIAEENNS